MKRIDIVLTILLVIVCVPLSLWGGARRWGGPTDMLPLLLIGIALAYLTFEGRRVHSAGPAVGLGILVGVAQYVPSLFLYDDPSILVLIGGYAAYSLIVYGVASAVRRGRAEQEEEDAHRDELTQLTRQRELLEEKLAIQELEADLGRPSGEVSPTAELQEAVESAGHKTREAVADEGEPRFLRTVRDGNKTYELFEGNDVERAKNFLVAREIDEPLYYVQVKTPAGVWGVDVEGLFLTDLLEWQTDLSLTEHEGEVLGIPSMMNLGYAAKGIADNFVVEVRCGHCDHEWSDALRYQSDTVVRCPACAKHQQVDSRQLHYLEPGM